MFIIAYLNVSSIIVNKTNFPSSGTTNDVGGIISANSKKNTVNDSKIDMLNDTWNEYLKGYIFILFFILQLFFFSLKSNLQNRFFTFYFF